MLDLCHFRGGDRHRRHQIHPNHATGPSRGRADGAAGITVDPM
jgi:hypothetical protein